MKLRSKQYLYDSEEDALSHLAERGIIPIEKVSNKMRDLTGQTFGFLTVEKLIGQNKGKASYWLCSCSKCEDNYFIVTHGRSLTSGDVKSCGCLAQEASLTSNLKHGMSKSPEYRAWASMLSRCGCESQSSYASYGAKGISVCKEWRVSFENFLQDMGLRPEGTSLDRIDPLKGYYKENCEWSNNKMQGNRKGKFKTNTTGFKGVSNYRGGTYLACLTVKGERYAKVGFATAVQAALWYDEMVRKILGEDATTNAKLGLYEEENDEVSS